jgi:uncharacterized protein YecE (DUF72 family)
MKRENGGEREGGILIGTQGFSYDEWKNFFYPRGLPTGKRLSYYAERFPLVELDSTYYAIPPADRVTRWAEQTPESFVISAKVPGSITHEGGLREEALPELARFFEVMRLLGPRLGPLCFQMPPSFVFPRDRAALEGTMRKLPEIGAAGLDLCIEFRHPSWAERDTTKEVEALLAEWGVAWVWNDWEPNHPKAPQMPRAIDDPQAFKITNDDFGYVRLTGSHAVEVDYRSVVIDRGRDLARWADLVRAFAEGRAGRLIYILLNNHYAGSSLIAMQALRKQLELPDIPDLDQLLEDGVASASGTGEPNTPAQLGIPGL